MPEAPSPPREEERLQELDRYQILDTGPESEFDDITILASEICDTPIALISFVDRDRQWFKSRIGLDVAETPRSQAFCAYAIHDRGVFVVPDALSDVRFSDNPLVTGDPEIRFYAGAPITTRSGLSVGTVCALDRKPRSMSERQQRALAVLGRQASRLLEYRYRSYLHAAFMEHSPVTIYLKDESGRYTYVNDAFRKLVRGDVDPLGRTSAEVFGQESGQRVDEMDREARLEGAGRLEVTPYGETEWLTSRFRVATLEGQPALAAIGIEVTETRAAQRRAEEAERQRREIIETIPAVIWERRYSVEGALTASFVNPYIQKLLGYTEEEWISSDDFWERAVEPGDRDALATALRGGTPASTILCRLSTIDDRRSWAEINTVAFSESDTNDRGTRTVIVDVTDTINARLRREIDDKIFAEFSVLNNELSTMQRTLVQQRGELQAMNEEKNQFIGMAAHDLRNPLSGILMLSDVLLRQKDSVFSEKHRRMLEQINAVSKRMAEIINSFLDVSKIEAGRLSLVLRVTDFNDVINDVLELQRPAAMRKEIRLEFTPGPPVTLAIDAGKIDQVLTNLITNAVKFSPEHTVVTVSVRNRGDIVEIAIEDHGPGVTPEEAAKIFRPFERGQSKPTAGEESVGLGLAICKRIVEGHGGNIRVESGLAGGATFYVELPRSATNLSATSTASTALDAQPSAPTSRHN